jgi:hypothetical protein
MKKIGDTWTKINKSPGSSSVTLVQEGFPRWRRRRRARQSEKHCSFNPEVLGEIKPETFQNSFQRTHEHHTRPWFFRACASEFRQMLGGWEQEPHTPSLFPSIEPKTNFTWQNLALLSQKVKTNHSARADNQLLHKKYSLTSQDNQDTKAKWHSSSSLIYIQRQGLSVFPRVS